MTPLVAGLIAVIVVLAGLLGFVATTSQGATVTRTVTAVQTQPVTQLVTVTAAPTTIEYTIGFAMAVSGPYAVDGPLRRDGGILAIEHINEYLKSIGSPVRFKYVHDDTQGTAAGALKVVQSMYAAGIRVIVGPYSSGEIRGVIDFVNTNKIVIIGTSSTSMLLAADDYVFRVIPPDVSQVTAMAQLMASEGIRKVALIMRNDDAGKSYADSFEKIFVGRYGGTVRTLFYTVGQPDYASEVSQLSSIVSELGAGDDTAVLIHAFEDEGLNIFRHASQDRTLASVRWFGFHALWRPASYLPPPDGKATPEIAEFLSRVKLTGVFPSHKGGPLAAKFEQDYRARFGRDPSPYTYFVYDGVWLAALAILFAGKYDAEAVRAALPVVAERFMGVTGYKAFDQNGDVRASDYLIWQYRFSEGKYRFVEIGVWRYLGEVIELTG